MPPNLDDIFSLTMWRSENGYCVGVQRFAGDQVRYETRKTASAAIEAAIAALCPVISAPPY